MRTPLLAGGLLLAALLLTGCLGDGPLDLGVGDCFDDTTALLAGEATDSIPVVPCDEPHDNEVYLVSEYPGDAYDLDAIFGFAVDTCYAGFRPYVGSRYEDSILDVDFIFPDESSWDLGRRDIKCFVFRLDLQDLRGSVRGKGL